MATNYVELKIKASDTAKPDLTDLRAKLDELGSKVESARVDVDDVDTAAKLADLNAKLAAISKKVASPRIDVAGAARAEAQLAAVDAALNHINGDSAKADVKVGGLRSRLLALGGTAQSVSGVGDVMGVFSKDASMGAKAMSGFSLATGLLEGPMSGVIVGLGGMTSGLAAAGIGAVAFGAVAKSAISNVTPAVQAYETALNTTGKAQKTAMTQYQQYMGALSGPQREMAKSLIGAEGAWNNFVQSNTSGVSRIMSQGIGLLPKVISSLQPLMAPVENALHGLISQLGHGLDSGGFKSFMSMIAQNTGPAITKLGEAIGHIVVGIGGIIRAFMPMAQTMMSGLDRITAKFAHWGSTLTQHSGFQSLMAMAKADMPYVISIVKNLGSAFVHLGGSMTGLSTFSNSKMLLQIAQPLAQLVNWLSKANPALLRMGLYALAAHSAFGKIGNTVSGLKSVWGDFQNGINLLGKFGGAAEDAGMGAKIAAAATKVWTGVQAAFDVVMDANPIMLVVIAIGLLVAGFILAYKHVKVFRDAVNDLRHDVASAFDKIRHDVASVFDWIKSHWPMLLAILTGPIGMATAFIVGHWHQIVAGAQRMVGDVIGFFRSLPGRIMSALSSLAGDLFNLGAHIIEMLAHGIESAIGDVTGAIGSVASEITSHLPFSPAKKGPLSGGGDPEKRGRKIAELLARGMTEGVGVVDAAANRVTGATAGGVIRGAAGGGGQQFEVTLRAAAGDTLLAAIIRELRVDVRTKGGGNVQRYLGWGSA